MVPQPAFCSVFHPAVLQCWPAARPTSSFGRPRGRWAHRSGFWQGPPWVRPLPSGKSQLLPGESPGAGLQHPSQRPHGATILLSVVATPWEHAQHHPHDVGAGIKGGL